MPYLYADRQEAGNTFTFFVLRIDSDDLKLFQHVKADFHVQLLKIVGKDSLDDLYVSFYHLITSWDVLNY